jgi:hypothetical protein
VKPPAPAATEPVKPPTRPEGTDPVDPEGFNREFHPQRREAGANGERKPPGP